MPKNGKKLRIAHIAPLFTSTPPHKYGGTERVLDWLITEQVKMGYDVTLFATGDSKTSAKLVPVIPKAIWNEKEIEIPTPYHTIELDMVAKRAEDFDVIHSHLNFIHYQSLHQFKTPMLTTLHWRVDLRELQDLYHYFNDAPLAAISRSQAAYIPFANVVSVIHHGLPVDDYPFCEKAGDYIAFVGRFSPEKGVVEAIETAIKLKMPIKIAARIPDDEAGFFYYEKKVKPLMNSPLVEYIGEVDDKGKTKLLAGAKVTLIPTSWPEPFGLVTIESLACGTPVVVFPIGCTKEIVVDGEVGFTATTVSEMAKAVKKIEKISRKKCREHIENNFSAPIMAKKYEETYLKLLRKL